MPRHHVIISGTGRAGTTFLMQVLTELGFPTGFANLQDGIFENCKAGMERDITQPDAPYIVKAPQLCDHLDSLVQDRRVAVDLAIIPVQELAKAADSRIRVHRNADPNFQQQNITGGLWGTLNPDDQVWVLARKLHQIMDAIAKHDIPLLLLSCPRLWKDADYLYAKFRSVFPTTELKSIMDSIEVGRFRQAHAAVNEWRKQLIKKEK